MAAPAAQCEVMVDEAGQRRCVRSGQHVPAQRDRRLGVGGRGRVGVGQRHLQRPAAHGRLVGQPASAQHGRQQAAAAAGEQHDVFAVVHGRAFPVGKADARRPG